MCTIAFRQVSCRCATSQSDPKATLSAYKSIRNYFIYTIADIVALRSDFICVRADLELHCTKKSHGPFSHDVSQLWLTRRQYVITVGINMIRIQI